MLATKSIVAITAIVGVASAALNTTQSFHIVTQLLGGQYGDTSLDNLYLTAYHSGAGLNDAVFLPFENSRPANVSANYTSPALTAPNGSDFFNLTIDLGNTFPYTPRIQSASSYTYWDSVVINAGGPALGAGAFFFNESGLQYSTSPTNEAYDGFGGWLVCNWWRGVPQLFVRRSYAASTATPANCAAVALRAEYF